MNTEGIKIFSYENYLLRFPEDRDAERLFEITSDEEVKKYLGESGALFADATEALGEINWFKKQFENNIGRWSIVDREENQFLGDIGFFNYDGSHKRIELGYKLAKEHWGKGVISNFISQLSEWCFFTSDVNRIEALVDCRNPASQKVLIKNRFQKEGTLREYEFEHGHFVDLEMYSLLRSDLG